MSDQPLADSAGALATFSPSGAVDLQTNGYFKSFGTNGRTCGHCHKVDQGWSITPDKLRERFAAGDGDDPVFRPVDGANSPTADVSTPAARRTAYSMLLSRGVIRVGIPLPSNAEFELAVVDDPYGYASAKELSLFRRPSPTTNFGLVAGVMWDGRIMRPDVPQMLQAQVVGGTKDHAQAMMTLPSDQVDAIVKFETSLSTAQVVSSEAGMLDNAGARGGPVFLAQEKLERGPFTLYDAWTTQAGQCGDGHESARAAVARGQALFNSYNAAAGRSCNSCHDVANVGSSSTASFHDIGVASGERRTPDMPLYTLRNLATGAMRTTTDPGRAMATGQWNDIDKFKVPGLRGLAARAPYFHNGSAATLNDVLALYAATLGFKFTDAEKVDLIAFLSAL